uniref:Uncharacterized protein n=1 Tax=Wolfiporia cocos TaxID=81056 RepID=A0A7G7YDW6_9APHY|nr:hypothetical protein [Wolfiporia cocos]
MLCGVHPSRYTSLLSRERKEHVALRMLDSEKNAFELNCDAAIAKKNIFVLNWLFKYLTLLLFKPPWNSVTALVTFLWSRYHWLNHNILTFGRRFAYIPYPQLPLIS